MAEPVVNGGRADVVERELLAVDLDRLLALEL
jgi:hypothetical protein